MRIVRDTILISSYLWPKFINNVLDKKTSFNSLVRIKKKQPFSSRATINFERQLRVNVVRPSHVEIIKR